MVIEYAVPSGYSGGQFSEFDPKAADKVIDLMKSRAYHKYGGIHRLGAYIGLLKKDRWHTSIWKKQSE
jgi:CTP synthase (UTP-ammonia lyase)